jgi:elongation factor P
MRLDGDIYTIVEFQHVKPGKGGGFVRTKLKNMDSGGVVERTFRSGDKVEEVRIEKREMQYLYAEAPDQYYFMDSETYEQTAISKALMGDATSFLLENETAFVLVTDDKPIGVELPNFVELTVTATEPGVKGDTATNAVKPATLETGAVVSVPLFVNQGDRLKIDTRTGQYVERV